MTYSMNSTGVACPPGNKSGSTHGDDYNSGPCQKIKDTESRTFMPKNPDNRAEGALSLLARKITMLVNWSRFWFANQESLDRQLVDAMITGNSATVVMLLKTGANVYSTALTQSPALGQQLASTPIHLAVSGNQLSIIKTLIDNGAIVQYAEQCASGLLASAVRSKNPDMLEFIFNQLTSAGIEETDKNKAMKGLWEAAVVADNGQIFDFILDKIYPLFIDKADRKQWIEEVLIVTTKASSLSSEAKSEIINSVIKKNKDDKELIRSLCHDGLYLFDLALEHRAYDACTVLLNAGVGVPLNKMNSEGLTPLHHVLEKAFENADWKCFEFAARLLKKGARMRELPEDLRNKLIERLCQIVSFIKTHYAFHTPYTQADRMNPALLEVYKAWEHQDPEAVDQLLPDTLVSAMKEAREESEQLKDIEEFWEHDGTMKKTRRNRKK